MRKLPLLAAVWLLAVPAVAQESLPKPAPAESPGIKVLKGLTVPEFELEMQMMVQALGVNCGFCHVRGNYASDSNDHKVTARRMLEMVKLINTQFFPDFVPPDGESKLGKITCITCHQGNQTPHTGDR